MWPIFHFARIWQLGFVPILYCKIWVKGNELVALNIAGDTLKQ